MIGEAKVDDEVVEGKWEPADGKADDDGDEHDDAAAFRLQVPPPPLVIVGGGGHQPPLLGHNSGDLRVEDAGDEKGDDVLCEEDLHGEDERHAGNAQGQHRVVHPTADHLLPVHPGRFQSVEGDSGQGENGGQHPDEAY